MKHFTTSYQMILENIYSEHQSLCQKNMSFYIVPQSKIKPLTQRTTYPYIKNTYTCVAILLTNLAEPEWIQVPCDQAIVSYAVCLTETHVNKSVQIYPKL